MKAKNFAYEMRLACQKSDIERSVTMALKLRDILYCPTNTGHFWRLPDGTLSTSHEHAILQWLNLEEV